MEYSKTEGHCEKFYSTFETVDMYCNLHLTSSKKYHIINLLP